MITEIIPASAPVPAAVAAPQFTGHSFRDERFMVDYFKTKAGQWIRVADRDRHDHHNLGDAANAALSRGGAISPCPYL